MNPHENFNYLHGRLLHFAAVAAASAAFPQLTDSFCRKEIFLEWKHSEEDAQRFSLSDLQDIPFANLILLGCRPFKDDLVLIPLWMYPLVLPGETLECINGTFIEAGEEEVSLDPRYGCIAYGFRHPDLKLISEETPDLFSNL